MSEHTVQISIEATQILPLSIFSVSSPVGLASDTPMPGVEGIVHEVAGIHIDMEGVEFHEGCQSMKIPRSCNAEKWQDYFDEGCQSMKIPASCNSNDRH